MNPESPFFIIELHNPGSCDLLNSKQLFILPKKEFRVVPLHLSLAMLKPPQIVSPILIALKIPGYRCTAASLQELLNNLITS